MMISRIIFVILSFLVLESQAQSNDRTIYYDKSWEECSKEHASYYRIIKDYTQEKESYSVINYFISGETQMTGSFLDREAKVKNGDFESYYENGILKEKGEYIKNKKTGLWEDYYENGQKKSIYEIRTKNDVFIQYWTETGVEVLINGEGSFTKEKENKNETYTTIFKDSVVYAAYSVDLSSNDTIYNSLPMIPEYRDGMQKLYNNISKSIRYPERAKEKDTSGRVYVQFVVNTIGELEAIKTIKGIGDGCDEEAERVIRLSSGKWISGEFEGKKVKTRLVLPLVFKLI